MYAATYVFNYIFSDIICSMRIICIQRLIVVLLGRGGAVATVIPTPQLNRVEMGLDQGVSVLSEARP